MAKMKQVNFWDWNNHREILNFRELGDAIGDYLDRKAEDFDGSERDFINSLPDRVTFYGYTPMDTPTLDAHDLTVDVLNFLDEEVGDPNGSGTEPTEAMLEAARAFHAAVLSEYEPWMHEATVIKEIDVKAWIAEFGLPFLWA